MGLNGENSRQACYGKGEDVRRSTWSDIDALNVG